MFSKRKANRCGFPPLLQAAVYVQEDFRTVILLSVLDVSDVSALWEPIGYPDDQGKADPQASCFMLLDNRKNGRDRNVD